MSQYFIKKLNSIQYVYLTLKMYGVKKCYYFGIYLLVFVFFESVYVCFFQFGYSWAVLESMLIPWIIARLKDYRHVTKRLCWPIDNRLRLSRCATS